jgi:hypothetical protein
MLSKGSKSWVLAMEAFFPEIRDKIEAIPTLEN